MATIEEVRAAFDVGRTEISKLDQVLAAERKAIRREAFHAGRQLTPKEVARRKEIAATRFELSEALEVLALATIDALEKADDLDDVLHAIKSVNQQLDDDLVRLQNLVDHAENAAKVADSIDKVADILAEFRQTLLG